MTYTCVRDFSAKGRDFTIGQKINATEYIALPAKDRRNFLTEQHWEILDMLDRGISVFQKGYLRTLGEMERAGIVKVDLYADGKAVVERRNVMEEVRPLKQKQSKKQ